MHACMHACKKRLVACLPVGAIDAHPPKPFCTIRPGLLKGDVRNLDELPKLELEDPGIIACVWCLQHYAENQIPLN